MSKIVLVVFTSLVIAAGAADAVAQTAGSTVSVSTTELRQIAAGWSAKKQILGKGVYNNIGEKIGDINDLIVTPDKAVSYAIVGVGGFLGVGEHEIAVPVGKLKQQEGKIVLPGATKDSAEGGAEVRVREVAVERVAPSSGPLGATHHGRALPRSLTVRRPASTGWPTP